MNTTLDTPPVRRSFCGSIPDAVRRDSMNSDEDFTVPILGEVAEVPADHVRQMTEPEQGELPPQTLAEKSLYGDCTDIRDRVLIHYYDY